jgi:hypothetical protein
MSSKTYIVAWDEVQQNVVSTSYQLLKGNLDFLVFDVTSIPTPYKNWVIADKVRYYGHFYNSLVDFSYTDHSVFIFNAGDPVYNSFAKYTNRVEELFSADEDLWVLAPDFTHDEFRRDSSKILKSKNDPDLWLSTQTNGIWIALRREIAIKILDFMDWMIETDRLDFTKMISGWGLDYVYCSWAIYEGKKVYRDWSVVMEHSNNSSYATGLPDLEAIFKYFEEYCKISGINANKIKSIIKTMESKATFKNSLDLKISDVYINKGLKWD